jgi:hydroxypyruvate reductase
MESFPGQLRADALEIFRAGIAAVEPARAVRSHQRFEGDILVAGENRLPLGPGGRIFVVGMGKAAAPMAAAVEEMSGERIARGVVVTKYGHRQPLRRVELLEAGHPLPDEGGLAAARAVEEVLAEAGEDDLVIALISGGGSALLPAPAEEITLAAKAAVTRLLQEAGADIGELNTVRKHLSRLKGGGLARLAAPARLLSLILSDVVGDPLDVIASGPTVADPTTFAEALAVLARYHLLDRVPPAILDHLRRGEAGEIPETPKPGAPFFDRTVNLLVGSNAIAVFAAAEQAKKLGYRTLVLSTTITGETRPVAAVHAALAREIVASGNPLAPPACLISGGETTVTVRGDGKGGRNQEFALAAALEIAGLPGTLVLSAGTDGTDGPTDAAGAFADGATTARAAAMGLPPSRHLENNDAYPFFATLGDLLVTGPTRTNVMDLRIILVAAAQRHSPLQS